MFHMATHPYKFDLCGNITQTSVRVSLFSFLVRSADFLIDSKMAGEPKFETKEGTHVSVLPLISYQVSFTDVLSVYR